MSKPINFQQREIKFRAWDGEHMIHDIGIRSGMALHLDTGKMHDWPLMQYTGLKDKNGREIYEGDVVRKLMDGEPDRVFEQLVMKWESEQWTEEGFMTGFSQLWTSADQYEIIGNIYENPELTKL